MCNKPLNICAMALGFFLQPSPLPPGKVNALLRDHEWGWLLTTDAHHHWRKGIPQQIAITYLCDPQLPGFY